MEGVDASHFSLAEGRKKNEAIISNIKISIIPSIIKYFFKNKSYTIYLLLIFDFVPTPVGGKELQLQPKLTVALALHVGAQSLPLSSLPPGISAPEMPGED